MVERCAGGPAIGKGHAKFAGYGWFRCHHKIEPGDETPPSPEPISRKLLEKIGKDRRLAAMVKEDDFACYAVSLDNGGIDLVCPGRNWCVTAKVVIKSDIPTLLPQTWRRIDFRPGKASRHSASHV